VTNNTTGTYARTRMHVLADILTPHDRAPSWIDRKCETSAKSNLAHAANVTGNNRPFDEFIIHARMLIQLHQQCSCFTRPTTNSCCCCCRQRPVDYVQGSSETSAHESALFNCMPYHNRATIYEGPSHRKPLIDVVKTKQRWFF
jgi:hypothetical protein